LIHIVPPIFRAKKRMKLQLFCALTHKAIESCLELEVSLKRANNHL